MARNLTLHSPRVSAKFPRFHACNKNSRVDRGEIGNENFPKMADEVCGLREFSRLACYRPQDGNGDLIIIL